MSGGCRHRGGDAQPPDRQAGGVGAIELYLVRHGDTAWSSSGRHTGLTDIPLDSAGEERARSLAGRLRGLRFAAVYSSTLTRAIETAVLAGCPPTEKTPLLVEIDYGQYDGITTREIRATNPAWDLWRDGCPGGEKIPHVLERARDFLDLAFAHDGDVIAFSHGHFLRALTCVFLGLGIETANRLSLETASISLLSSGDRGPQLSRWNDTGHLPAPPPAG